MSQFGHTTTTINWEVSYGDIEVSKQMMITRYNLTDIYTHEQSNKSRESHHCSILI